jgi:hypothetical protein
VKHAKTAERVPAAAPAEAIEVAEAAKVATPEVVPEAVTIPQPTVSAPASTLPAPPTTSSKAPAVAAPPVTPAVPKVTTAPPPQLVPKAATVPSSQAVPKATPAPAPVAAKPPQAPLDLASLGTRLKQTRAIGVLTKLSLKNQVDDLLEKFRAYHKQQGTATLPELRRAYDMLLLKVLSLLQDSDPPLARDIVQSRAAIWGILADPRKFNEASLMAGATT